MKRKLLLLARIAIGILFIVSGFTKAIEPAWVFEMAIRQYGFLPSWILSPVAYALPWLELILGSYLILELLPRFTVATLFILTVAFQVVLGYALIKGIPISHCGCFGEGFVKLTLRQSFILETVLVVILLHLLRSVFIQRAQKS